MNEWKISFKKVKYLMVTHTQWIELIFINHHHHHLWYRLVSPIFSLFARNNSLLIISVFYLSSQQLIQMVIFNFIFSPLVYIYNRIIIIIENKKLKHFHTFQQQQQNAISTLLSNQKKIYYPTNQPKSVNCHQQHF